jgi:exosortase
MSADADKVPEAAAAESRGLLALVRAHWPILLGFGAMAVPTFIRLAEQSWPMEIGAHGPIVLATGVWLLFYIRAELAAVASKPPVVLAMLGFAAGVGLYAFGRPYDLLALEAAGVYVFFLAAALLILGLRPMLSNVFPFLYLAFLIPIPGWILDKLTSPLRMFVSFVATNVLEQFGYPIDRQGIVIFIAQYRLLVEDACSGMNSLIGLIAVMLFYIYIIHRASLRYTLLLAAAIIPIAVIVNIIRVMALILLTYYAGDEVAQGFLHVTTGIVLFAAALGLTILLDATLRKFIDRRSGRTAGGAPGHA